MGTAGNKKAHSDTGAVGNIKVFNFSVVHISSQMQYSILNLLGSALVPELGADIAAGSSGNRQLILILISAVGATPLELSVTVLHNLNLSVITAGTAIVGLAV